MKKLTAILIAALLSAAALAQPTDFEDQLATILASGTDGVMITCPPGYPISGMAACYRVWGSFDLTSAELNRLIRTYSDASWPLPWSESDARDVLLRPLAIDGRPLAFVILTPSPTDDFETIVWVIEEKRFP